tara:strand:- start:1 stop:930 length:930 start_codon:yes stop_codon:yes gene_type:complete
VIVTIYGQYYTLNNIFMVNINIKNNINLLNFTTIKIGGHTEFFAEPENISELIEYLKWVKINNLKYRIIGAGSNLLIRNTFHKGLTICTRKLKKIKINKLSGFVEAECGVMLPVMANLLGQNGCSGGEWLIGIPGTIGGAVFMNAGSGKLWISKYLLSVQVLDTENLSIYKLNREKLIFKYRFSSFQTNKFAILTANFMFKPNNNIKKIIEDTKQNLKNKTNTQPYHLPSFGSVFKNPTNNYAGKLIEEAGLKGFSIGGAQVSNMHSNFIVNNGDATSDEIYQLITAIQQKVLQQKGIFLHPEVRMIGY